MPGSILKRESSADICMRKICERSIKAGGLSEEETDYQLKVWEHSWNDFCAEQLQKAGHTK